MHIQVATLSLQSSYGFFSPCTDTLQNPRLFSTSLARRKNFCYYSFLKCRGVEISAPSNSPRFGGCSVEDEKLKPVGIKDVDVATLGNLCVDVVLNVPELPPKHLGERKAYMEELSKSPPDKLD